MHTCFKYLLIAEREANTTFLTESVSNQSILTELMIAFTLIRLEYFGYMHIIYVYLCVNNVHVYNSTIITNREPFLRKLWDFLKSIWFNVWCPRHISLQISHIPYWEIFLIWTITLGLKEEK